MEALLGPKGDASESVGILQRPPLGHFSLLLSYPYTSLSSSSVLVKKTLEISGDLLFLVTAKHCQT